MFGPFPTSILSELRQKFSFNITPFQQLTSPDSNTLENEKIRGALVRTDSDETKSKVN